MPRLTLVVDVEGIDATLDDPHEVATDVVYCAEAYSAYDGARYAFVSAEWSPNVPPGVGT